MKRHSLILLFFFACTFKLLAQDNPAKVSVNVGTGFTRQNLNWSIAGNLAGKSPNIYSELQWENVGGQSLPSAVVWNFADRLLVAADYSHVFLNSGAVTDRDYSGDNRSNMVYNQRFNADKGHASDWSLGAGYQLLKTSTIRLNAFSGYRINAQSLFILDRTGNFANLNSTYSTKWKGPFVKATADYKIAAKLFLSAALSYNQINYGAVSDWNLIPTFQHPVSYRHTAKGFGLDGELGLKYTFSKNVAIQAAAGYFSWKTGNGIDELFLENNETEKTQLNKVERTGFQTIAGLLFSF